MIKHILYSFAFCSILLASASNAQEGWSLDSCIRYANAHNPGLQLSELNVQLAEINQLSAVGGLLPSLNAQASHGYNWGQRIDPFTNQFASERVQSNNLGVSASVNLFSGFQQVNSVKQARIDVETGKWRYEKAKNDLALNVASAFLTVLLNREFLAIAESNVDNTQTQVNRMTNMVNAGQMAEGNLDQMKAQLASDQANEVSARNNYDLAILNLTQLMQLEPSLKSGFQLLLPDLDALGVATIIGDPSIAVTAALANFPEIKGAQTTLASAEIGERIARGARYPRISASYSYGSGYSGASRVLSGSPDLLAFPIGTVLGSNDIVLSVPQPVYTEDDYSIKPFGDQMTDNVNKSLFFSLTIPLFNGFSTHAGVKRAEVNYRSAALQLDQAENQLRQEVERAYADARAAFAVFQASTLSREASEKSFRWTETRFDQGLTNQADFSNSRGNLDIARANETRNKFDYIFKLKVLDFYLGKPISLK